MNSTVAVIVTYNRCEMLLQCISSLRAQTLPCDILVIDNASTDSTPSRMQQKDMKDVHYFRLEANTGGAGGFHEGIKRAVLGGWERIWLMDDDTLPSQDALEKLIFADQNLHGSFGWLSSAALWIDGSECRMNRQKLYKNSQKKADSLPNALTRASQATFVSLYLKRDTVLNVGLPISEFFIWGDDIEYTRRIAVRYKEYCYLVKNSVVIHAMSDNNGSKLATDNAGRIMRYRYAFRNENYLYRQEGLKGFVYYVLKCGKNSIEILLKAKDHKFRRLSVLVSSFILGFSFNPEIRYIKLPHS